MRIVHFSDWHGRTMPLPAADLYVCTGDMLPNFRILDIEVPGVGVIPWGENLELLGLSPRTKPIGVLVNPKRPPDHAREKRLQADYLAHRGHGYLRRLLGTPDAPVVCVRGNHDFTDLAPAFDGGETLEIGLDPTVVFHLVVDGRMLRIGGMRGMAFFHGNWADELTEAEFARRAALLPRDLDLLVTHNPGKGILDEMIAGEPVGSAALRADLDARAASPHPLLAHCFGHIHEACGTVRIGTTTYSNAATGFHVIDP
jgi:Icc-related predicted phosphoesterase